MKNIANAILLIGVVLCNACIEEVDPKGLDKGAETVVINGFLSPSDTIIAIQVSHSRPVIGKRDEFEDKSRNMIKTASVTLSNDEGNSIDLIYNDLLMSYSVPATSFSIEGGETYHLAVIVDNKTYTSTCTIPSNSLTGFSYRYVRTSDFEGDLVINFTDAEGGRNFYRIGADLRQGNENSYSLYFDLQSFQTDAAGDGGTISARAEMWSTSPQPGDQIVVKVATVDELLYRYQYASYNYYGDDPFSEPVVFPSNIEGGLGLFVGYQLTEKVLTVN